MNDQVLTTLIIAFFASLAPTIAAFAALMVSRNTDKKSDVLLDKTTEIHTLTNSNLSNVTATLAVATEKISGLEKMIQSLQTAKIVADRVVEQQVTTQNYQPIPPPTEESTPPPTEVKMTLVDPTRTRNRWFQF